MADHEDGDCTHPPESPEKSMSSSISASHFLSPITTRTTSISQKASAVGFISEGTMTDNSLFKADCRIRAKGCRGYAVDPSYLKAYVMMMSELEMSPRQAILASYYMDTVVHGLERTIPLELDKEYECAVSTLKKLEGLGLENDQKRKLTDKVNTKKAAVSEGISKTLMTRKCVTEAQHDMATYVEGKVAEEMVSHGEALCSRYRSR